MCCVCGWWECGIRGWLAAAGVVLTRREWRQVWVYHVLIVSMACSVALFYVLGRYRFPLVPLLMPFAAAGLVGVWESLWARKCFRAGAPEPVAPMV